LFPAESSSESGRASRADNERKDLAAVWLHVAPAGRLRRLEEETVCRDLGKETVCRKRMKRLEEETVCRKCIGKIGERSERRTSSPAEEQNCIALPGGRRLLWVGVFLFKMEMELEMSTQLAWFGPETVFGEFSGLPKLGFGNRFGVGGAKEPPSQVQRKCKCGKEQQQAASLAQQQCAQFIISLCCSSANEFGPSDWRSGR